MEVIKKYINEPLVISKNFARLYKQLPYAIFDIETTGLNPGRDKAILIGVLYPLNNQMIIEQIFCNTRRDEKEMLLYFKKLIQSFPLLINYNGDSFDIPFLNRRFEAHRIPFKMDKCKSLDLLRFVRKRKNDLNLENYKLKTIEKYMGIQRQDVISGKESVDLYNIYEMNQENKLKEFILLHNHDDLYYLNKCLNILDSVPYKDLLESVPLILIHRLGKNFYINSFSIKSNILHLSGTIENLSEINHVFYEKGFTFEFDQLSKEFKCAIPLLKGKLSSGAVCYYLDMNDFPFSYVSISTSSTRSIPENLIILKENGINNNENLEGFITSLMNHLGDKLVSSNK